jgi:hypothetical protein
MRRLILGGVAAALLMGLGVAVATTRAGDYYEDESSEPKGLLSGVFGEKPKSQATKSQANRSKSSKNSKNGKNASEATPKPVPTAEGGYVEQAAAEQQRRMNALIRRMEVCDRLRMIADQTGNEALMLQANELEERANALYRNQMAGLPLPAQTPLSILADENRGQMAPALPMARTPANRGPYGLGPDRMQSEPRPVGSGSMGGN